MNYSLERNYKMKNLHPTIKRIAEALARHTEFDFEEIIDDAAMSAEVDEADHPDDMKVKTDAAILDALSDALKAIDERN